ncbi:Uncharacterized protein conserved in bacteria [Metamycoplasma arthritidis]|uniref:type II CRISPR RNA-guided endonuclease Cas9 n=1 Tax=Metamycoplasma arthritidis TaxID=2111 RepID=UPI0002D92A4D|nr:type II CRISPR RNA-guided endonuclease Cas9 [Metamycoplasma arthritidis]VEU78917.1 Uncharacterized protein conserved in bacteria [Metamycoplasma arthritidis]
MEKKTKVILGFDLGIGSVGWSIVNKETDDIIDLGSRLFPEPELAVKRREARSSRRINRRKKYRNLHFYREVVKHKNIFGFSSKDEITSYFLEANKKWNNILELKCLALKEKVSPQELVYILHDYLKNRGFFYNLISEEQVEETLDEVNDPKKTKSKKSNKKSSLKAKGDNKEKFEPILDSVDKRLRPSEKLFEAFKLYGFSKELSSINNDKYKFHNNEWVKEIEDLFATQGFTDSEFAKHYLSRFKYVRSFAEGPGSEHSPSKYGIYEKNEYGEVVKKYNSIWEKTIGKCSVFEDEYRAPKQSPSAALYNLLVDLANGWLDTFSVHNNVIIERTKIPSELKFKIINGILESIKKDPNKKSPEVDRIFKKIATKELKIKSPKFDYESEKIRLVI